MKKYVCASHQFSGNTCKSQLCFIVILKNITFILQKSLMRYSYWVTEHQKSIEKEM